MTKKRRGPSARHQQEKVHLNLEPIEALTPSQQKVLSSTKNLVLHGMAGTGKTFLASYLAYKAVLKDKTHKRVIYFRSAVATRNIGFYPGTEEEKMAVFEAPYVSIAVDLFTRGDAYMELKKKRLVEFKSTSHTRGTTINDAVVIVDEAQNMTLHELDSIITRAGKNVRFIFSGDTHQADLSFSQSGLSQFMEILDSMKSFHHIEFNLEDIVRGDIVKEYLMAKYKK